MQSEVETWCIDEGGDVLVSHLLEDSIPKAFTLVILEKETSVGEELQIELFHNSLEQK